MEYLERERERERERDRERERERVRVCACMCVRVQIQLLYRHSLSDSTTHLYKRLCPSVGPSIHPSGIIFER